MKRLLFFLLLILPLLAKFRWIRAAEIGIKVPVVLRSPSDYSDQIFKIPFADYLKPGESVLKIHYQILDTIARRFFLKVSLNYHTLHSSLISDTSNYLNLTFPTTWLGKYNRLEFFLDGPIDYGVKNTIEIDSIAIGADVERRNIQFSSISKFVELSSGKLYLVAPEKASVKTLSALSLFSQVMGFLYGDSVYVVLETNPAGVKSGGIVVIGTPEEQPYISEILGKIRQDAGMNIARGYKGKFIWQTIGGKKINKKAGVLIFVTNNLGVPVLIISSATPDGIRKGLSTLMDNSFEAQNGHAIIYGTENIFLNQKWVAPPEGKFKLSDLKWNDILLKGERADTTIKINFLPGTKFYPQSGHVKLSFVTDKILDPFTSKFSVFFNGHALGTYYFSQVKNGLDLKIPGEFLQLRNNLNIKVELRSVAHDIKPHVFMSNKSAFDIKRTWSVTLPDLKYLKYMAFPVGATYKNLKTAIVMDHYTPEKLKLAVNFSRFIGLSGTINSTLVLSTADSTKKNAKGRNLVLIGHDFDILSPADSSLYIEELIYPQGKTFRTFLVLHCVDEDQIEKLSDLFQTFEGISALSGQRVNFSDSGVKYIEPVKKFRLAGNWKNTHLKLYLIIANIFVLLILLLRNVLTSA